MKKTVLVFTMLLCLFNRSFSQQASKTLDFIQAKDGRKLYGKITEMDPKEGISIQTYGDGNVVKLKHDEIDIVKMGSNTAGSEEEKSSESIYRTSVSLCYVVPSIDKQNSNSVLFSKDPPNNFGFKRIGIHVEPTLIAGKKSYFGFLIGYEKGRNFSVVPLGFTIKLGKKFDDKNLAYLNLKGGFQVSNSRIGGFTGKSGKYIEKESHGYVSPFAGIGLGFLHDLSTSKLFADITYRFDSYSIEYYEYSPQYPSEYFRNSRELNCDALQIRVGIMF